MGFGVLVGAYFALVAWLRPTAISFDGLAFLMNAREGGIDYGHALYLPLLRGAEELTGNLISPMSSARLVSALGAALVFTLLWQRIEGGRAAHRDARIPDARILAGLVAACFALATLVWQEAGSVEPTSWTTAALLLAAAAAEARARRPTLARHVVLLGTFALALGFHLAALFALPWLLRLARTDERGSGRARLLGVLVAILVSLGALGLALALDRERLGAYLGYWSGFVPDFGAGAGSVLAFHLRRGARLVLEGAPILALAGLTALALSGRRARAVLGPESWLAASFLAAFVLLGKPLVALWMPVLLALALVLGRAALAAPGRHRRTVAGALALAVALQLALTLPQALAWRRASDRDFERAARLVEALPADTRLFAGGLAHHLRFRWPDLDLLSLPELWHRAHVRERAADPIAVVEAARAAAGKACAISSDAVAFLISLGADPTRLGLSLERARLFPGDPELALFPLEARYDAEMLVPPVLAEPVSDPAAEIVLSLERAPFDAQGLNGAKLGPAFTLVLADADLDGDLDVLVNWHLFAPLALWWNEGGGFLRRPAERPWSLPDHARVPLLEGTKKDMLEGIAARERSGVYAWHSDSGPFWFFAPAGVGAPGATLHVETNRPILAVMGLEPEGYTLRDERFLEVPLVPELSGTSFFLATKEAAIQLEARIEGSAGGATLPFFVGSEFTELPGPLDFWFRDPHGIAWLDVRAGAAPEVFVTRGALRGQLAPPFDPKHDDFFVPGATPAEFTRLEIPGDWGRGRAVQWVDLEGDGVPELYVSSKESPNRLLVFDPRGSEVRDVAPERGLDFEGADAFAWLDLDGDGDEDLVTLDVRTGLGCVRSEEGRRFERDATLAPGLRLPPVNTDPTSAEGIDEHDLVLFDLENDGDLDVLVTAWGPTGACVLFVAEGAGFVEASERVGLAAVSGVSQVVLADLDADGFLDLLCLGKEARLFRNLRGVLHPLALPADFGAAEPRVGASGDVDGDGRIDVVLAGRELWLARNRGAQAGPLVELTLTRGGRAPIGALVRAHFADGSVHAARVGSTHRGHLSQSHGPLQFASPRANPLRRLELTFPGGAQRTLEVDGPGPLRVSLD